MSSSYKNNYKKFFRQLYLLIIGILIVFPFIIDAFAGTAPQNVTYFNKSFTDILPIPRDTVPLPKDTNRKKTDTLLPGKIIDSSKTVADTGSVTTVDSLSYRSYLKIAWMHRLLIKPKTPLY